MSEQSRNPVKSVWSFRHGPNGGAMRAGIALESTQHCADSDLWRRARPGEEAAGLWYVGCWKLTLATPWRRFDLTYLRGAPRRVLDHANVIKRRLRHAR